MTVVNDRFDVTHDAFMKAETAGAVTNSDWTHNAFMSDFVLLLTIVSAPAHGHDMLEFRETERLSPALRA
jgi:hypothetical protein